MAICFALIFPWMHHIKSIEGEYSVTSSESRYRFVWDQAILVTSLSKNISYQEAKLETEYSDLHKKKYLNCKNILNNSILRSKCFNDLTNDGYNIFFTNSFFASI